MATQQGNMEPGTRPCAKRVVALPVEGVLSPNNERSELSGEARRALPVEGVLNPNNCLKRIT